MIVARLAIIASLFLISCSSNSGQVSSDLDRLAQSRLRERISKDIQLSNENTAEIVVDRKRIRVSVSVEHDMKHDERGWIFAGRFQTRIDETGENIINVGSVGIGKDRNDAIETAIDEWVRLFGTSLSGMLVRSKASLTFDNVAVYPGDLGFRGTPPTGTWLDGSAAMHERVVKQILPTIKGSSDPLTWIELMVVIDDMGRISGECRLNSQISNAVLEEMKKLDWKPGSGPYIFKQFYIIARQPKDHISK